MPKKNKNKLADLSRRWFVVIAESQIHCYPVWLSKSEVVRGHNRFLKAVGKKPISQEEVADP